MKIGMRIVKTSIAVFFSIVISRFLGLESGFFACIAAVISMESSIIHSFRAGINRIIGTILGAFIGLMFALISPGNPFLAALGIFIIISLCKYFKWNKAITISCTVFNAIMINLDGRDPFLYSSHRLLETLLGISIALIINYLIKPPDHNKKIEVKYNSIRDRLLYIIEDFILNNRKQELTEIKAEIVQLENIIKVYENEIFISNDIDKIRIYKEIIDYIKEIMVHIEATYVLENYEKLNDENLRFFKELFHNNNVIIDEGEISESHQSIIYNFNIKNILQKFLIVKRREDEII